MSKKMPPILLSNLFSYSKCIPDKKLFLVKKAPEIMKRIHENAGFSTRVDAVYKFFENDDMVIYYIYGNDPGKLMTHDVSIIDGRHYIFIYQDNFATIKRSELEDLFNAFKSAIEFIYELISPTLMIKENDRILNYAETNRIEDINLYSVVNFVNMYTKEEFEGMLAKHDAIDVFKEMVNQVDDVNWLFDQPWKQRYEKERETKEKDKRF